MYQNFFLKQKKKEKEKKYPFMLPQRNTSLPLPFFPF